MILIGKILSSLYLKGTEDLKRKGQESQNLLGGEFLLSVVNSSPLAVIPKANARQKRLVFNALQSTD